MIPGSYDRCLRGIKLLRERGLPLKLKTVATSINKHEVVAMRQFAEEELGVEFKMRWADQSADRLLAESARGAAYAGRSGGPRYAYSEGSERIPQAGEARPGRARQAFRAIDTVYFCGGGHESFAINAYGEMSICVTSQQETSIFESRVLQQAWEHSFVKCGPASARESRSASNAAFSRFAGCVPRTAKWKTVIRRARWSFSVMSHICGQRLSGSRFRRTEIANFAPGEAASGVLESARRIRSKEIDVESWVGPPQILPDPEQFNTRLRRLRRLWIIIGQEVNGGSMDHNNETMKQETVRAAAA